MPGKDREDADDGTVREIPRSPRLADCPRAAMSHPLEILPSMEASRAVTRKSASNLALAFIMLPKEKRDAMSEQSTLFAGK